jgi:NTP pyrophosphatase (non-canonical NTP hydrolase)
MDINLLKKRLSDFAEARNWDPYHNPKNLTMALASEAGELLDIFLWLTPEESQNVKLDKKTKKLVEDEAADIFMYLLRLADKLDIDLEKAVDAKLKINAKKYPVKLAKNNAVKYNRR